MKQGKGRSSTEIIKEIDKDNEHLNKLKEIRDERKEKEE